MIEDQLRSVSWYLIRQALCSFLSISQLLYFSKISWNSCRIKHYPIKYMSITTSKLNYQHWIVPNEHYPSDYFNFKSSYSYLKSLYLFKSFKLYSYFHYSLKISDHLKTLLIDDSPLTYLSIYNAYYCYYIGSYFHFYRNYF